MLIRPRLLAAVACCSCSVAALAVPIAGQGTWETTLKARDISGHAVSLSDGSAYFLYDTVTDLTWLRKFDPFDPGPFDTVMTFQSDAIQRAGAATFGGFSDWRLPRIIDSGAPGPQTSYGGTDSGYNVQTQVTGSFSEWAHLYYVTLGNRSTYDTSGNLLGPIAPADLNTATFQFRNAPGGTFHSSSTWIPYPGAPEFDQRAWVFNMGQGSQVTAGSDDQFHIALVRSGDVLAAVPEPGTVVMLVAGLAVMAAGRRRRPAATDSTCPLPIQAPSA